MTSILPHGGKLVNRIADGTERDRLLEEARRLKTLAINAWTISDLDLIGVGAFSPLTGFLNEADYRSVLERMRLADGTVWSIPVTLAIEEETASGLALGERVALAGEDGVVYGLLEVQSLYKADQQEEALKVFKTADPAHPGVAKLLDRPDTYVGGPVTVLNRPVPEKFG